MNKAEWAGVFAATFPDGALITLLGRGSNEVTAPYDESPQELVEDVEVRSMADEDSPVLSFFSLESGREYLFTVDHTEPRWYGLYVVTIPNQTNLMISNKLTDFQRQYVKQIAERY